MAKLILNGATSGSISIESPAVSGTTTLTLPTTTDTLVGKTTTDTLTNKTLTSPAIAGTPTGVGVLTAGTSVSASGTSVDFTSIPSWVKRITVMLSGVSTNGTSEIIFRIGTSGGIQSTGYLSSSSIIAAAVLTLNDTTGFRIYNNVGAAADVKNGALTLTLLNSVTDTWSATGSFGDSNSARLNLMGGSKGLSATLTQVRITTVNGTDTFDAGSINILYE